MVYLRGIRYHVPETLLTNEDLVRMNPKWSGDSIFAKTGIRARPIAGQDETAGDFAFLAAEKLIAELQLDRTKIDALLFCTESPDYLLPPTACLLQERMALPKSCAAFDFNLGCSGFVYGLWLARALILSQSARNVLLLVGDTYSKYCNRHDLITSTIFGDGAAAALISEDPAQAIAEVGPTAVGTDGRGAQHLIVRTGGARHPKNEQTACEREDGKGNRRNDEQLFMNGPEVFNFTITVIQPAIQELLDQLDMQWSDVDYFMFHQANRFMLEQLRRQLQIMPEKMPIRMENLGNTVSATIPILLRQCETEGMLKPGHRCILAGFGVGYSWGVSLLKWIV